MHQHPLKTIKTNKLKDIYKLVGNPKETQPAPPPAQEYFSSHVHTFDQWEIREIGDISSQIIKLIHGLERSKVVSMLSYRPLTKNYKSCRPKIHIIPLL